MVYIITAFSIYSFSQRQTSCEGDVAIVLGAAVWTNIPSPVFRERINHAINLYKEGKVGKIIFTGGKAEGDELSESETGRRYAIGGGVDDSDILVETTSATTYQNILNSKKIIDENNFDSVVIVSDPLHLKRANMMADKLGIDACSSATPTTRYTGAHQRLTFLLRETYFYLQHFVIKQ